MRMEFEENTYYHIYNRGLHKQRLFHTEEDFKRFIGGMGKYIKKCEQELDILAYCLLPNHFHFVVHNKIKGYGISYFIGNICAGYVRYYKRKYNIEKGITYFEERFRAKELDTHEYLDHCIRYVQNNPIKHGIIDQKEIWPFVSSAHSHPGANELISQWEADLEELAPGCKVKQLFNKSNTMI